ncbi:hypothetical protein AB9F45_36985, partial [Rhizobium leguminosarum]
QAGHALSKGARNILLAPPSYFNNVSDDGVFQWFSAVFAILGDKARDIIVYNSVSVKGQSPEESLTTVTKFGKVVRSRQISDTLSGT